MVMPFIASNKANHMAETCVRDYETSSRKERGCMGWTLKIVLLAEKEKDVEIIELLKKLKAHAVYPTIFK